MESRRQDVSEDGLVKSRRYIPVDLVMEILSRLPAKSITRCRCVSKLWASMFHVPEFTELFLSRSQARPRLLFTCHKHKKGELVFFSSPQPPEYSDSDSRALGTASSHMKIPFKYMSEDIRLINGLVIFSDERILEGRKNTENVSVICNPSTGQSLVLPEVKKTRECVFRYLGYDPIEKQFKVLSITAQIIRGDIHHSRAFQVLTLGTKKMLWRKVECCIPHVPTCNVICINGVLYYEAYHSGDTMIACFDIRSEKFCFLKVFDITGTGATLINHNGKLASFVPFDRGCCFELWILKDAENNKWSMQFHVLPPLWKDVVRDNGVLNIVGMVGGNEIVFSPCTRSLPFYVFYYNIEQNTIRRVEIQGLLGSKGDRVCTFLNHLEDIKPIDGY